MVSALVPVDSVATEVRAGLFLICSYDSSRCSTIEILMAFDTEDGLDILWVYASDCTMLFLAQITGSAQILAGSVREF